MLLFGVVSYKVRPRRLVSYAFLYTTNAVYAVMPEKTCVFQESKFFTSKSHGPSKELRSFQINFSSKVLGNRWELKSGPKRGDPASAVTMS